MNRPVGSIEAQREYLDAHVRAINAYTQKRLDFIRYFRSGATHLDSLYFLRGQTDTEQYLETFYYELDPQFSTNADFKGGENPGQRYVVGLSYGRIGITGEHEPPEHGSAIV